jgi:NarL family two-component system response regulator LiaR
MKGLLLTTDLRVVGETGEGEEALRLVRELQPDLVTLGLNLLGEADGIHCCWRIKELSDPPKILVHTTYNFTDDVSSCLLAGADSYVHKRCECEELLGAMRRTVEGERVWWLGGKTGDLRSRFDSTSNGNRLTEREREVVVMMIRRCNDVEISKALYLSLPTVKTHVRSIMRKLNLKNRWELY